MAESPHHAVWLLLTKSAACKLDFDGRVCPRSELCDAADKCEKEVTNTLESFVGRTINRDAVTQAGLPGLLGRHRAETDAQLRRCRTQATTKPVKEALGTSQEFVNETVAEMASERLIDTGVKVSTDGQITMTDWAKQMVAPGEPTTPPIHDCH